MSKSANIKINKNKTWHHFFKILLLMWRDILLKKIHFPNNIYILYTYFFLEFYHFGKIIISLLSV